MKDILKQYKIQPSKSKGQNFLINKGIVEKIVVAADLSEKDVVLEIGPGLGVLTEELLKRAGKVIAVEKDKALYEFLRERFEDADNLELINEDILKLKRMGLRQKSFSKSFPLRRRGSKGDLIILKDDFHLPKNYKLVANLPYSITGKIFRKFLSEEFSPKMLVVMVQKEIGEKLLGRERSMLTILRELYGKAEKVCIVKQGSFFPAPKIDSMVVKLRQYSFFSFEDNLKNKILQIAKIGFSSKRKKLISNLSTGLKIDKNKLKILFKELDLKEYARAEELSIDEWLKLAKIIIKRI